MENLNKIFHQFKEKKPLYPLEKDLSYGAPFKFKKREKSEEKNGFQYFVYRINCINELCKWTRKIWIKESDITDFIMEKVQCQRGMLKNFEDHSDDCDCYVIATYKTEGEMTKKYSELKAIPPQQRPQENLSQSEEKKTLDISPEIGRVHKLRQLVGLSEHRLKPFVIYNNISNPGAILFDVNNYDELSLTQDPWIFFESQPLIGFSTITIAKKQENVFAPLAIFIFEQLNVLNLSLLFNSLRTNISYLEKEWQPKLFNICSKEGKSNFF